MSEKKHNPGSRPASPSSDAEPAMHDERMQAVHDQLMREKSEPSEGFSPIPIVLLFVFAALCFWGGVYLVESSGGFRWDAYSPDFDPHADVAAPVAIPIFERGERIYRSQCVACHQAEGTGIAGVYPPLDGAEWVIGHPEVTARILINGLNGPIEVNGATYNGNMPAFGPNGLNLRPDEIAAVITFIRQSWGNSAPDVTEDMMDTYMAQYASRGTPWTADELREGLSEAPVVEEATDAEATDAEATDEGEAAPASEEAAPEDGASA